ncbi:glycosyltransferase family A protein [uncultured Christiangramia sp.]|uniref:glycosyltransferase family 2 protein n=1 Tax=uncultured Christiangramia sp. TaxID=503836 RepID=UPI0026167B3D|nr:glycosyltransferase family A protein [uncultured Christiangramia sp.]
MLLSILIPTYNRSVFLNKNLTMLKSYILDNDLESKVEIVVSNNFSSDDTSEIIGNFFKDNPTLSILPIHQSSNIGLLKNALEVLKNANFEYVMYLGDDDYIDENYLNGVITHIENNKSTHVVLPSLIEVNIHDEFVKNGRDFELQNSYWDAGYENCLENGWRGHQLSGLVLKRNGIYDAVKKFRVSNLYIFVFFTAYSCLKGNTFHYTKFPVRVTNPGQKNKDWNYGEDGLINDLFDNYINLPLSSWQITKLQLKVIESQPWRLWKYKKVGDKEFLITFKNMWFSKNSTYLFKIAFPLLVLKIAAKKKLYKLLKS